MALRRIFSSLLELCVSVGYFLSNAPFTEWKALAVPTELWAFVLCGKYSAGLCALVCCISLVRAHKNLGKESSWMDLSVWPSFLSCRITHKIRVYSAGNHQGRIHSLVTQDSFHSAVDVFEPDWKSAICL